MGIVIIVKLVAVLLTRRGKLFAYIYHRNFGIFGHI